MPNATPPAADAPPGVPPNAPPGALTPERWRRARAAFDAAVERAPTARAAVLDAACAGDAALRAMVEDLLVADADASVRLGPPLAAFAPAPDVAADVPAVAGRRVGPYRLVRELGRGGMGTVYLAEREDVGRRVALKLVRGGLAAPERVGRFLVERRVLARLDHPHVARLLDAGVVDDGGVDAGTPWFAMEYVDGWPLDRYCDARRLGVAARLALVEQACEAVAYAHRNLVVHRDLKPSNLLVTADGDVKLLDFGIAKLLADDAEGAGAATGGTGVGLTEAGVRLLTPEYAAPEQARGEPVTTATDVYALGVVLYELLAGRRPHELPSRVPRGGAGYGRSLGAAAGPDADWHPTRPSAAAARARAGHSAAAVAAARGTTPDRLRRQLAGDLDTIVLKALDPDPERRYASAAELLDDLRRHRTGFPVRARPDSPAYRARAFVRRNGWGVAAATGLFALLAGTATVTSVQQARTRQALARATAEAAKARQVTRFVTALIRDADPYRTGAAGPAAAGVGSDERLGLGAERLERELARQPAVRAELLHTLGAVALSLGRYDQADTLLRRALATRRQLVGARAGPDAELAGVLHDLGVSRRLRSDLRGADTLLGRALAIRAALPGDHDADLDATRYELATVYRIQARFAEAGRLLRQVIASRRRTPGPALADALEQFGLVRYDVGDYAADEALARETIAIRERWLGPEHPAVAVAYQRLGTVLNEVGRVREAERAVRWALAIQRRRLPAGHPDVLYTESELSWVLLAKREYAEAERVQRRVLDTRRRLNGEFSRDAGGSYLTLGTILQLRRDAAGAADALRHAVASFTAALGPDHPLVRRALETLAVVEAQRGRETAALDAVASVRKARYEPASAAPARGATAPAPEPPGRDAQLLAALASLLRADGDCRRAGPLARRALAAYTARHPGAPPGDAGLVQLRAGVAACEQARRARR
ncbi:hypothetical protein tb265_04810 [Gemmatimonadetes bacterium T265]|nr:hypothetical protein tb265_04810 [Gemmatimonadetes bacterium T265]